MSWRAEGGLSGVYDYEVGVSSTTDQTDPELLGFTVTHHHAHFYIDQAYIPEGKKFYLLIKAISRAGVWSEPKVKNHSCI